MTILLVRHGRAAAGLEARDPGLDSVGIAQAEATARALRDVGAERLVVSPLKRARETAAPAARLLSLTPEICPTVAEVFRPDLATARRTALIGPLLSARWNTVNEELQKWRELVLSKMASLAVARPTIVVSHYVAISVVIGAALDDDRVSPTTVPNASITRASFGDGRWVLHDACNVSHLKDVRASPPG